jgi:2-keto-4-pentenoate hydratase
VPDSRFDDFANAGAPQLLADDACAGFFVLGPEVAGWRDLDLPAIPVAIGDDAGHVHRGSGANALGDPRVALAWFVADRARRGITIEAGQVVTTGTCAKPLSIAPGRTVTARFGSLGAVTVRLA